MLRDDLVKLLKTKEVTVVFKKVSGDLREMHCTLKEEVLPKIKGTSVRKRNEEVLPVWDLDKEEWRSFRLDSIIEVK